MTSTTSFFKKTLGVIISLISLPIIIEALKYSLLKPLIFARDIGDVFFCLAVGAILVYLNVLYWKWAVKK
jgi:hypothetical protein